MWLWYGAPRCNLLTFVNAGSRKNKSAAPRGRLRCRWGGVMTTNVLDRRNSKVTSDSRWSVVGDGVLYFVDDTGFDKIEDRPFGVMVCAGNAALIEHWRTWFINGDYSVTPPTEITFPNGRFDAIYVTIVTKPVFTIAFSSGLYHTYQEDANFCGSGAEFAKDCYSVNGCAHRCIETAKAGDPQTGGEVLYYDFNTAQSNLNANPMSLDELNGVLLDRGMAMDLKTQAIRKMTEVEKDALRGALNAGTASLCAPTGQAPRAWTDREKADAKEALRRIVELEKMAGR